MGLIGAIIVFALFYYGGMALMSFIDSKMGYNGSPKNKNKPSKKDVTVGHEVDFRQVCIDSFTGKCDRKELKRRFNSGHYNKDKEN